MKLSWIAPLSIALLYGLFWRWYSGTGKPLTSQEIDSHLESLRSRGASPDVLRRLRGFLEADTGRGFVMVNLIRLHEGEGAVAAFMRYNRAFLPRILKRASHPVLVGKAAAEAVEVWGIEDGARWSSVGLVRYRSRRDMIEAAADPLFASMHPDKVAAMSKTIAVPADPWGYAGDPRLLVGLLALIAVLIALLRRR